MQIYKDRTATAGADWRVISPNGKAADYRGIDHAYVDEKTGTLHLMRGNETALAVARGFWAAVEPVQ